MIDDEDIQDITYTLVLVDPDAPSAAHPIHRQYRHWVIPGIKAPGEASTITGNLVALKTRAAITPYTGPAPTPGSGVHRYTFLLFQEPISDSLVISPDDPEHGETPEQRQHWNAVEFGDKYDLKLVGANFFLVSS
jgi:phosphatidylethanolamine-binding protein (PEBP) family uncharacterized protein